MEITLNGETTKIVEPCTAAGLIEHLQLQGKRLAIEVNLEIVPRSQYTDYCLQAGDRVEIVHAIGGG